MTAPGGARARAQTAEDLDALRAERDRLVGQLEAARAAEARACVRTASTLAAILTRELKKIPTSERLVAMTRRTGTATDAERYADRHQLLLATIDDIADQYRAEVEILATLDPGQVAVAFQGMERDLLSAGRIDRVPQQRTVRAHVTERREERISPLDEWKEALKQAKGNTDE